MQNKSLVYVSLIFTNLVIFFISEVYGQKQILNGKIICENEGPIRGVLVECPGFDKAITDLSGNFELLLKSGHEYLPFNSLNILLSHSDYGFFQEVIPMPQPSNRQGNEFILREAIEIPCEKIGLIGQVVDDETKAPLSNIDVGISLLGFTEEFSTVTNRFGVFGIKIPKSAIGTRTSVRAGFRDPNGCYLGTNKIVELNDFEDIELVRKNACMSKVRMFHHTPDLTIDVTHEKVTTLRVKVGDRIRIQASGQIRFGLFAGVGGPDGVVGFQQFSYLQDIKINHGVLLLGIGDYYYAVGAGRELIADREGSLRFLVNDADNLNNIGSFKVDIFIDRAN